MIAGREKIAMSLVIAFYQSFMYYVLFPVRECVQQIVESHTSPTVAIWREKRVVELIHVSDRRYIICHFGTKFIPQLSGQVRAPAYARAREADKLKAAKRYLMVMLELIVSRASNRTFV